MMKNKLFGRNIVPDCSYCNNSYFENGRMNCRKGRQIQDAKCKRNARRSTMTRCSAFPEASP